MLAAMLPLLDGDRSAEEIIGLLLADGFDLADVLGAFDALDRAELLVEAVPPELAPLQPEEVMRLGEQAEALAAFVAPEQLTEGSWPPAGLAAQATLKQSKVGIAGVGTAARALARTLALAGVGALTLEDGAEESLDETSSFCAVEHVVAEAWPELLRDQDLGVLVYFPDHFAPQSARLLNAACVDHDVPFLPCRAGLYMTEVGPLVIPGETACYQCFETRRRAMGGGTDETLQRRAEPRLAFPIGVELLALEVVKFLTTVSEPLLRGHLWTLHLVSGAHELHPVLKLPRCAVCGGLGASPPRRIWDP